jgi:hypothetical protein
MRRDGGSRLISFKKTSLITMVVFLLVIAFCGCKNNKGLPDKIYYIDTLSNAAFKGLSYGDAITLKTIQGIVNRDKPRFYTRWPNRANEESPSSIGQRCRVIPGGGDSKDSATEINRPALS